jgi:hypothetical protein
LGYGRTGLGRSLATHAVRGLIVPGWLVRLMPCFEWSSDESVEFHLPHGEMIALLRENAFEVQELIEIRPPDGSTTRYRNQKLEWAQRWPCEEIWKARKND